jgi:SAM-dependent methyltransferase
MLESVGESGDGALEATQRERDYRALDLHRLTEYTRLDDLTGRHRIARVLAPAYPHDRALEIGCAQGYWVNLYLRQRVRSVAGIDVDHEDVERAQDFARRHPADGVMPRFLIGSAEALPLPDASYSLVYLMDVIEHVSSPVHAAAEAQRVLAPEGRLVVTVPGDWLFNFLDPHWPEHRHYRLAQLVAMFRGLEVVAVHRTGFLWNAFWGTYVRFVLARATRLVPGRRRARALSAVSRSLNHIADLDCRANYGFGAALCVVLRKPGARGARPSTQQ